MNITITDAVGSLRPNTNFSVNNGEIVAWDISEKQSGETQPTKNEIDSEIIRLKKAYSDNEYARNRATAYDSVGDQLDMIYKDMKDGTTTHKASVEAVKAKYPKPE